MHCRAHTMVVTPKGFEGQVCIDCGNEELRYWEKKIKGERESERENKTEGQRDRQRDRQIKRCNQAISLNIKMQREALLWRKR